MDKTKASLPDGIFAYQKDRFRYIFEDLGMENDSTYVLLPFDLLYGHLVYFVFV
jgi:hypothetical protein